MNYLKHYINLCRKAINRTSTFKRNEYENHHTFPESIYGKNKSTVKLTLREHYIAHLLLWKSFKKRYGPHNYKTRKMAQAFHMMVFGIDGDNHRTANYTSKQFNLAKLAMYEAKKGKVRTDMLGKKYFGASEETIKASIEKMRIKKIGMKIENYPKNRKSVPCTIEKAEKIRIARLKTKEKYIAMTDDEFSSWIKKQNPFRKDGKKNSNFTRALIYRNVDVELYYDGLKNEL
jgi:hypothetical protein